MITEENFLDFKCPYCSQPVSFPENAAGSVQECPDCLESLVVPQPGNELGGILPLPITTPRLTLRRFGPRDWEGLLNLLMDEEGFASVDGLPGRSEEEVLRWLEADAHVKLTTPNQMFHLAIELQKGGRLIGFLGFWFTDAQRLQLMFNISLHQACQHKGLALEAVEGFLVFCFNGIKLHRIAARCDSKDAAACRLCEAVGMRREGEFVKDQPMLEGGWGNTIWYAVLDEEYRKAASSPAGGSI
jgi:RimJ/RimL family protein N-acetyltransferase